MRESALGPEVLLLERPSRRGGGLHPVTGKAHKHETPLEAAAREALEETGLTGKLTELGFAHDYEDVRRGQMREHAFVMKVAEASEPRLSDEHIAARWVPAHEVDALLEWPAHRQSLRLAMIAATRRFSLHPKKKSL